MISVDSNHWISFSDKMLIVLIDFEHQGSTMAQTKKSKSGSRFTYVYDLSVVHVIIVFIFWHIFCALTISEIIISVLFLIYYFIAC